MLEYNDIKPKKIIDLDGEPYEVLDSHVFRKQQRKPVNATKLRHLVTGKITERSFHQSEKVNEIELGRKTVKFLYHNRGEYWFSEENDPSKRFFLSEDIIGPQSRFLKPNLPVDLLLFEEKTIGVRLPIKIEFKVTEAPPGLRGDTARGGLKQIVLEGGATISAPLFVNEGDIVVVNTETGEYSERK